MKKRQTSLITTSELEQYLKCSKSTIHRMIKEGLIPYYHLRSGYRFDLQAVLDALSSK